MLLFLQGLLGTGYIQLNPQRRTAHTPRLHSVTLDNVFNLVSLGRQLDVDSVGHRTNDCADYP